MHWVIKLALDSSRHILEEMIDPTKAGYLIHQTYNILIRAYAGVTLVEYADHLPDIQDTFRLMEKTITSVLEPENHEPVFHWAKNVMRKKALDAMGQEGEKLKGIEQETTLDWTTHFLVDSMFPFNAEI